MAALRHLVEQLVHDLDHQLAHPGDRSGRERHGHEPFQAGVVGRIGLHQPAPLVVPDQVVQLPPLVSGELRHVEGVAVVVGEAPVVVQDRNDIVVAGEEPGRPAFAPVGGVLRAQQVVGPVRACNVLG